MMAAALVALAATLSMQAGYFLWKVSSSSHPHFGTVPHLTAARALVCDWRWLAGFAATAVGWVLFIQATALGDISLVQPLMTVGDVFLVLLAVTFLHERLSAAEWVGVMLTVAGAGALAADSSTAAVANVVVDRARLVLLIVATALCAAALLWSARGRARPELALALVVGLAFGCGAALTKAMTAESGFGRQILFQPLLPGVIAANVVGLALLQIAFQRGRASVIVPLQLAMTNGVAVAAGTLVYGEHIGGLRWAGIAIVLAGTALLHRGHRG